MSVVRLDHLNIHAITERASGDIQQPKTKIDAHTHIRGKHDGYVRCGVDNSLPLGLIEAGGADYHTCSGLAAVIYVAQCGVGIRKIY